MPPFEHRPEQGHALALSRKSSFLIDESGTSQFGTCPDYLERLWKKVAKQAVPAETLIAIQDLFERACELDTKAKDNDSCNEAILRAVEDAIRSAFSDVVYHLDLFLDMREDEHFAFALGLKSAMRQGVKILDRVEATVSNNNLSMLNRFLENAKGIQHSTIRISLSSPTPALELRIGQVDTLSIPPKKIGELPMKVTVTPYFVETFEQIAKGPDASLWNVLKDLEVRIEGCKHKKLCTSSRSTVAGEVTVRVKVTPRGGAPSKGKEKVWNSDKEVSSFSIAHVRAVQKNALVLPREIVLSEMDLYTSSTYGSIGFSVAMKMKTFKTVDEQPPIMEIQLIMQRPTQLKSL